MFSAYGTAQQTASNVVNTAPTIEAQAQFAAYRQDVTGSPHHSYHPHPAAAAAGTANLPAVQTFNNVALPAQHLL